MIRRQGRNQSAGRAVHLLQMMRCFFGLCLALCFAAIGLNGERDLRIRFIDDGRFHTGELIELETRYRLEVPELNPSPSTERCEGFLLEPSTGCGTLEHPCRELHQRIDPRSWLLGELDRTRQPTVRAINAYLPPLKPGHYRLAMILSRHEVKVGSPRMGNDGFKEPRRFLVSNWVDFTIERAPEEWVEATVDRTVARLRESQGDGQAAWRERRRALDQLRFLGSRPAKEAALDLYREQKDRALLNIFDQDPKGLQSCELMRAYLRRPESGADFRYVDLMAEVCTRAWRPFPEELDPETPENRPLQLEWIRDWRRYRSTAMAEGMVEVARRQSAEGLAGRLATQAVLRYGAMVKWSGAVDGPAPPFVEETVARVLRELPEYEPAIQLEFLQDHWTLLHRSAAVLALRGILDDTSHHSLSLDLKRRALHLLAQLDPKEARHRLIKDLREFRPTLDPATLELLPPNAAAEMDQELIDYLAACQKSEDCQTPDPMLLIARYLTAKSSERMRRIYDSQLTPCQPAMLAYFVRADREYAAKILERQPMGMGAWPDSCTMRILQVAPPLASGPELDAFLVRLLRHENSYVVKAATQNLELYGSASAEGALWDALRSYHDRGEDEARTPPGSRPARSSELESQLRDALARGRGWLITEADLRIIGSFCVGERCKQGNQTDLQYWKAPLRVTATLSHDMPVSGRVAHYTGLRSLEQIESKLAQFPEGTTFELNVGGRCPKQLVARVTGRLQRFAQRHGLTLVAR